MRNLKTLFLLLISSLLCFSSYAKTDYNVKLLTMGIGGSKEDAIKDALMDAIEIGLVSTQNIEDLDESDLNGLSEFIQEYENELLGKESDAIKRYNLVCTAMPKNKCFVALEVDVALDKLLGFAEKQGLNVDSPTPNTVALLKLNCTNMLRSILFDEINSNLPYVVDSFYDFNVKTETPKTKNIGRYGTRYTIEGVVLVEAKKNVSEFCNLIVALLDFYSDDYDPNEYTPLYVLSLNGLTDLKVETGKDGLKVYSPGKLLQDRNYVPLSKDIKVFCIEENNIKYELQDLLNLTTSLFFLSDGDTLYSPFGSMPTNIGFETISRILTTNYEEDDENRGSLIDNILDLSSNNPNVKFEPIRDNMLIKYGHICNTAIFGNEIKIPKDKGIYAGYTFQIGYDSTSDMPEALNIIPINKIVE